MIPYLRRNSSAPRSRTDATGLGIAFAVINGVFIVCNDVAIKLVTADVTLGQIIAVRGVVSVVAILVYVAAFGRLTDLRVVNFGGQAARAGLMVSATFLYFFGLRQMPIADLTTFTFIAPIVVAAASPFFLGEPVGWRRWTAIVVGFGGVIVMLRPSPDSFYWIALFPLASSMLGGMRDIVTRKINVTETSMAMLFYTMLFEAVAGAATIPFGWTSLDLGDIALLAGAGLLFALAQFLSIEAFRLAEAATISPFRYVSLIWAMIAGFVIWGHLPDGWTLAGGSIIVGSGLYIFHRQAVVARALRAARAQPTRRSE
ncbi:MAG: DMT family transporter [Alphaproteobacteria bacterium]|nr:DMT family transporter [Alphaproteobacteria bacterium]